jgi:hypothetical protein
VFTTGVAFGAGVGVAFWAAGAALTCIAAKRAITSSTAISTHTILGFTFIGPPLTSLVQGK